MSSVPGLVTLELTLHSVSLPLGHRRQACGPAAEAWESPVYLENAGVNFWYFFLLFSTDGK